MQVKIINGVKLEDGVLYEAGSVVEVEDSVAENLIETGEAEAFEQPKVAYVRTPKARTKKETKKDESGEEDETTEGNSALVELPYRTLQVKASELGMPKVVGVSAGELGEFIASKLSEEEVNAFVAEQSK